MYKRKLKEHQKNNARFVSKKKIISYLKELFVFVAFTQCLQLCHCVRVVVAILRVNIKALPLCSENSKRK